MKIILLTFALVWITYAQGVFEPTDSDIYEYLESLSVRGIISFDFEVKPQSRIYIAETLVNAEKKINLMTDIDKSLLEFYLLDYSYEIKLIQNKNFDNRQPEFIVTESNMRLRFFEYTGDDFAIFADPKLSYAIQSEAGKNLTIRKNGFSLYGYANKSWAFSLSFFDNEESGTNLDIAKDLTPERGTSVTKVQKKSFEYDVVNASVAYQWSKGSVSIGKEYLKFGNGINTNIILGDKAPSFPFIRIDYKPVNWLRFFYFHGFLVSNVPDSTTFRYSPVPGRYSISDVSKFIAFHSLSFYPKDNISVTLGESIIYSDKIQPVYFIPVIFFRVADHYLSRGNSSSTGNAQLFADASYKNYNIKTKFYASLFIDELSFESIFKGGNLSAIGFTIGLENEDMLFNNSSIGIEYTRINPFVYMNSVQTQLFENDSYVLGGWTGSNGDILNIIYKQYFSRVLKLSFNTWYFRKGKKELPVEQYTTPYPEFLYGAKRYEFGFESRLKLTPLKPLSAEIFYKFIKISDQLDGRTLSYKAGSNHYYGLVLSYCF